MTTYTEDKPPRTYFYVDETRVVRCLCEDCGRMHDNAWPYQGIYGPWEYQCFDCKKVILEANE